MTLPATGRKILIDGTHPWAGNIAVVTVHQAVGIGTKRTMARVRIERDDALDGHECYVGEGQWKYAKESPDAR